MLITLAVRFLLVVLFFPFSALDKMLNFKGAVGQAQQLFGRNVLATLSILIGLFIEIVMSLGVITGVADRLAALILALYCMATAVLFKQFWAPGDFWHRGESKGRDLFWDFLKNFSLAGGFLLITFGTTMHGTGAILAHPFGSTHPYAAVSRS
ncbi:DoxX family membrane protein [Acidiphilium acidophilum]|uniref:DoxX family membrane protein n=1 Tax=Acidiphilium acidophilum TaxID=76588 RepID=A0AAW9DL30_ACIAO|nr:DoxX family membrane protein [Acidiphilium acidophilum]MDX5929834.1 DoxX family membrane protein [Acidiphilium acidophilum]MEE3503525.1 DoxX family membrane protein [Acidiphilium acidophilum]GBR77079.1 DoxX family protein [Acidiphilium acidophilum DSM 700]